MSSTFSPSLRIELIGSGDQAGAWGATTDSNFAYVLDTAIAGYQVVPITSTNQALTYVNGPTSLTALNQSVYAMLSFTGASAATNVYIPPVSKQYIVRNNSGYTITIYNSTVIGNTTAAGTGISVVNGDKIMVWSDATNVFDIKSNNVTGTVAIANGGTGQITQQLAINALAGTQTNNRVLRSDGTNTTLSQVNVGTDVTGTLPVLNGGTGGTTAAAITALVGNLLFPIGALYTATVSTNPGTLLGFGTWTAFGAGRMLISADGTYTIGSTGGAATTTLVTANLPSHTHTATVTDPGHSHSAGTAGGCAGGGNPVRNTTVVGSDVATTTVTTGISVTNSSTGSGTAVTTISPYIAVYMWQRTA